ncbi:MarR family winged helix-turn-helix transcriptional regulator [Nocardia sp. NPDC058058]|uniref:MarR family winged helix-turn-helix transcriptional regulator n=1 Tax=Nocardia sp. NPDC058058 TaxID=3346317 RepID=UPI0036DA7BB6
MTDSDPTTAAPTRATPQRGALETGITADIRALGAISDQLGHLFARSNNLRPNDFRALMHISSAEDTGRPLTPGQLGRLMGMSSAAVTYLVERLIEARHVRRGPDPTDRRRIILHRDTTGHEAAEAFFTPVGRYARTAMTDFPDQDLAATHRVLTAITQALHDQYGAMTDPA